MDSVEQGLLKLQQQKDEDVRKYNLMYAKSVYQAAEKSGQCSANQSRQFKTVFPELENMNDEVSQSTNFNPQFVVEFVDGKPTQVLRSGSYNSDEGLLPHRQVMDKYWVDVGKPILSPNQLGEHFCTTHQKTSRMYYNGSTVYHFSHNASPNNYNLECGCNFRNCYANFYKLPPTNLTKSIERKEHRVLFYSSQSYEWEVDNYLNLYHRVTGLYLMFNKTVLPMVGFYLSKQFNPFIFISKRLEEGEGIIKIADVLVRSWLEKLDNQPYLLEHISQIIPDNYEKVFDTFNRFRKLDSFQSVSVDGLAGKPLEEGEEGEDIRDQLIRSYKIRLEETLLRAEKAESYQHQMLEDYRTQSSKLQELQLELDQKIILEKESIYQQAQVLVREHLLKERVKLQELEASKQKNLELQTLLSEKEVQEGKFTVVNSSLEVLKREKEGMVLKMEKVRHINTNLMANLQDQKKVNAKLQEDNQKFHESYLEIEVERNSIQKELQEKVLEIAKSQQEVSKLTSELVHQGETSSNCLENALSDQVDQLKNENESHKSQIQKITQEYKSLENKLKKYQNLISRLTTDLS